MGLELFFRNLKYLARYNLKGMYNATSDDTQARLKSELTLMVDNLPWELEQMPHPNVLSAQETVEALLANDKLSLCRFGDGEIYLAFKNQAGVFQRSDSKLADELKAVLTSRDPNIGVAVPYHMYHSLADLNDNQRYFYRTTGQHMRQMLQSSLSQDWCYYDTNCSMPYHLFTSIDFAAYYQRFAQLWSGKDIIVICGKTVFNKISHNIFDSARSVKYIYGPRVNAYDKIDELTEQGLQTDPEQIKFIILGHTATVLAYRLAKAGHRAIDIGHLAKDYNSWQIKEPLSFTQISKFYDKD